MNDLSVSSATISHAAADEMEHPRIPTILKHLSLNLLIANVVPGALFYLCLRLGSMWLALFVALGWCYGVICWRLATKRRTSGLLLLTAVGLTAKTVLALASGSTFIYFLQPAANDAIVALLFLLSLATTRPVVARLAGDFYPMSAEVAGRPRIRRLFWHLTLLWAVLCLTKSGVTVWLLESLPPVQFVAIKSILIMVIIIAGIAVTVEAARRVAKREGLLHRQQTATD
jgi:hypothetical protein